MSVKKIQAAVLQLAIKGNDKAENFKQAELNIRKAVKGGAQLIVQQELHATHYFCQEENTDFFDLAESLDGETYQAYAALAAELDVVMVISQFEKRAPGLYHNTAQVIDGQKGRVGIFRKMHIPDDPGFYEKFYFTPGDADGAQQGFKPIETSVGKLGVLICWDQWYPEAARLMAMAGADCLIYPTAIGWDPSDDKDEKNRQKEAWTTIQRSHAIANGLPVLVANRVGVEAGAESGIDFWGGSFIAGPQGEMLMHLSPRDEGFGIATLDFGRSENVRRIWPYFRDRRIDAYSELTKRWRD